MGNESNEESGVVQRFVTIPWLWTTETIQVILHEAEKMGIEPHEFTELVIGKGGQVNPEAEEGLGENTPLKGDGLDVIDDIFTLMDPLRASEIDWQTIEPFVIQQPPASVIRHQISRITPLIVNTRIVAYLQSRNRIGPTLQELTQLCVQTGRGIRAFLKSDEGATLEFATKQRLSSGFPRTKQESLISKKEGQFKKSTDRYTELYVGSIRKSDLTAQGVLQETGWIHISEKPPHRVTITSLGMQVARESFPFIERCEILGSSLIPEDLCKVILNQIELALPEEQRNYCILANLMQGEGATNSQLVGGFSDAVEGTFTDRNGSVLPRSGVERRARSIVASTINRMEEMGLVRRQRISREEQAKQNAVFSVSGTTKDRVRYFLTPFGEANIAMEVDL